MSVSAEQLVSESKLMRQSGHAIQSLRLISVAKTSFPKNPVIEEEERKVIAAANPSYPRWRSAASWAVDRLGLPAVFIVAAVVASLLGPILFVAAG